MKKCGKCGGNNEDGAKFCADCGAQLNPGSMDRRVITVGRHPQNNVVISAGGISNKHCELIVQGGAVTIRDLTSTNGTYVNGAKITEKQLKSGDNVMLGKLYSFDWQSAIRVGEAPVPPSAEPSSAKGVYIVGRAPECDRVIDNFKVSRRHCKLFKEGSTWFVEDLGSSNGTFVNGKRITREALKPGDIITVGGTPFTLDQLMGGSKVSLEGLNIEAQHLAYHSNEGKKLIDDISLTIGPGQFIGLIGPSGAGKTTLMYLLCGINNPSHGDVKINGESLVRNPDNFKGVFGYVPQDDILHRELEVMESLMYTGKLRLGHKFDESTIAERATSVIHKLHLEEARNVRIGSPEKKGISGGQRKKVNLGQELMTDPNILVLDEPTSGLDPKSDKEVMTILRGIADTGRTVLLTTHNISESNFKFLTHVIVLAKTGKLAYYGPASEAAAWFGVNDVVDIFDSLEKMTPEQWKEKYRRSAYYANYAALDTTSVRNTPVSVVNRAEIDPFNQFLTLTSRYFTIKIRDTWNLIFLLIQAPVIGLLINLLFNDNDLKIHPVFILVISTIWLGTSNAVREIVNEKSIFKRERMVNLSIGSYIASKFAILFLFSILQSLVLIAITTSKFNFSNEASLFGVLVFTSFTATVMGLLISAYAKTEAFALTILPLVLIPTVIFGGLVQPFNKMAEGVKAFAAIWLSRWSYELSLIIATDKGTEALGFKEGNTGLDLAIIGLMFVVFLVALVVRLAGAERR